jgi:uridine kinase
MTDSRLSAQVVGLSSPSGGGKTTIVKKLASVIPESTMISFNDYDGNTIQPSSFRSWLDQGADYNAWKTPRLASDLRRQREGRTIEHPINGSQVGPSKIIIYDAPLGKAQEETGSLIDFMVFIDTPLDIAMARRLLRDAGTEDKVSLSDELRTYLDHGRQAYLEMDKQIKHACDLIVNGMNSADAIAEEVASEIRKTDKLEPNISRA